MKDIKNICYLWLGIALYVVLSATVKIPIIGHIQTDLGYVAFGAYCELFGPMGCVVGVFGCLIESLIFSGWIPAGWILGQIFIGITCGICYKKTKNRIVKILVTIAALFVGIAVIKTVTECLLYNIPFGIKFAKNLIASIADANMIIGVLIAEKIKTKAIR